MNAPSTSPRPGFSRLLLVATGSLAARNLPFALTLLRESRPGLSIRVVVTRSAERFVTRAALAPEAEVMVDEWPQDAAQARHVDWAEWAEVIVVYPMTLHFMGRLALGLADTPALLAAQCTRALVALAPALPPGGVESAAYQAHWSTLSARPNVVLVPPRPGISTATGRPDSWLSTLAQAIEAVDARWEEHSRQEAAPADEGTGHLVMEVTPDAGGFVWRRRPGPLAHSAFAPVDPALNGTLAGLLDGADVRLAPGEQHGEFRAYHVAGAESAARILLRDGPGEPLERLLRGVGRALRELHALPPGEITGPPRAMRRLEEWLAGRSRSATAAAAGAVLADRLGAKTWDRLRGWCAEQDADPDVVLSHGAPGLGSLAVDPDKGTGELLIGEDLCAAPWYHDLAWLAGELVEMRWLNEGDPRDWQRLIDALFDGYGRDLGEDTNRLVAMRIARHLHDISAYVGLDASLLATYAGFLDFLVNLDGGSPHARNS
ncbi:phosphopantothenoylcysteine decarboxylase/phosphopantothenate--cysteine ligase [Nonomuraea polychroma]|uniref:Phosphopantothenoylcysteine decarboxylase/phosphopantothenate--cysteine ligase n=1 Tax=Nonomuraea polychroma TaxID=46176 RepID=A0A438LZE5_9ACTN|nr:flavoprotein [Nonomuraea polychroma]RVX38852.1 phosphopantothenoylcysteine decarboxylase/phosphopantothenate--cysteine ligase [Nonomuraea polychroma]